MWSGNELCPYLEPVKCQFSLCYNDLLGPPLFTIDLVDHNVLAKIYV
jgi:hypothetical protein